eukprot:TRINITY_DN24481_c0_g1_i1.p1 TRINITY_DN24481_c0_g1~~TRINITY_DN24481_c0_g1_i1.p1  ORF type:complete len:297 (+),score=92.82 TRINITY_DN24481_c0_g1_i1:266-1156(+)
MGDHEFSDPELTMWQTMIAGSAAGMSEHLVMFPIDTIKTRTMSERVGWRYPHMLSAGKLIAQEEGLRGFYRGFAPAFLSAIPSHAAMFTAYEHTKSAASKFGCSQEVAYLAGAGAATCLHDTVSVPFDVVKQRLQENCTTASSAMRCFRHIYAQEGITAFTRSLPATYLMNFPNQAVHWLTYETAKVALGKEVEERVAVDFFACGAIAGMASAIISNPLDLLKTRIQLGCDSYSAVIHRIYMQEGIRGFWRGVVPRMTFHAPSAALTMTTYELTKSFVMKYGEPIQDNVPHTVGSA